MLHTASVHLKLKFMNVWIVNVRSQARSEYACGIEHS
jgi:hypothetical protein